MAGEIERRANGDVRASTAEGDVRESQGGGAHVYVRTFTFGPKSALGRFAVAAALIGAGALFLTVGLAIAIGVLGVAAIAGSVLAVRRSVARIAAPPATPAPPPLDPANVVKLPKAGG